MYCCLHQVVNALASCTVVKISPLSSSSLSFPLKLSTYPFSQGLPRSMNSVCTPSLESQDRTALAMNSIQEPSCEPQPTPFVVYAPAISPEESRDTAVTIPTILRGQRYDALRQNGLVVGHLERVSLGTAHLTQHTTRPTLGDGQRLTHVHDRLPPSRQAQKFPRETSFRIALSSA